VEASPDPDPKTATRYVLPKEVIPPDVTRSLPGKAEKEQQLSLREAVTETLKQEFRRNPNTFLWGQDVASKEKGGVFNVTKGMQQEFGRERVFNAPIAEDFILGTANGFSRYRDDIRVVGQAGDGGTVDIGFGTLSGMFERNDDVLFVCYDNEGYMNTGVQRSGATPPAARTANTKAIGPEPGNVFGQGKNVPLIAMAHEIPYVATATVAELRDLEYKVEKAMSFRGARYLHVFVPCPLGWGAAAADTIKLARLAKETGIFPVFEAERGTVTEVSRIRRQVPVEDYLRPQRRYAHLFGDPGRPYIVARLQARADHNILRFGLPPEGDE
jgi:pyruvate/2-oxoacid:ferredoxin oxidoreductase beta subunit